MPENADLIQKAIDNQSDTEPLRILGDIYGLAKKVARHKARQETYELLELDVHEESKFN